MGKIDLTGQPFGRLVVIREAGRANGAVTWLCRCLGRKGDDCGNEVVVDGRNLRSGKTKSCGCLQRDRTSEANTKHGKRSTKIYAVWQQMMCRAGEGACDEYTASRYKERGINVCEEWKCFEVFYEWAIANGYKEGLPIDRKDNDKGYCPENCHWVSQRENANNRHNTVRLDDGTPLALFCYELGIVTCGEDHSSTPQYKRISRAWVEKHKIHPEFMQSLKDDTDNQSRLLEITKLKCRRAELMISAYKELLASKQTA